MMNPQRRTSDRPPDGAPKQARPAPRSRDPMIGRLIAQEAVEHA